MFYHLGILLRWTVSSYRTCLALPPLRVASGARLPPLSFFLSGGTAGRRDDGVGGRVPVYSSCRFRVYLVRWFGVLPSRVASTPSRGVGRRPDLFSSVLPRWGMREADGSGKILSNKRDFGSSDRETLVVILLLQGRRGDGEEEELTPVCCSRSGEQGFSEITSSSATFRRRCAVLSLTLMTEGRPLHTLTLAASDLVSFAAVALCFLRHRGGGEVGYATALDLLRSGGQSCWYLPSATDGVRGLAYAFCCVQWWKVERKLRSSTRFPWTTVNTFGSNTFESGVSINLEVSSGPDEQNVLRYMCCIGLSLVDGYSVEDTVPFLFGLCHRRRPTAPPLLILRFDRGDFFSLSSVKAIRYLQLNTFKPQVHTSERPLGESPAGHQLIWSTNEALGDCNCSKFEPELSTDDRPLFDSICSLRYLLCKSWPSTICYVKLRTADPCSELCKFVLGS